MNTTANKPFVPGELTPVEFYPSTDPIAAFRRAMLPFIKNDRFLAERKYDGNRLAVDRSDGGIIGFNKLGEQVAVEPWMVEALGESCLSDYRVDGELLADSKYIIHDLLRLNGVSTCELGAENRQTLARIAFADIPKIEVAEYVTGEAAKLALMESEIAASGEGIVFKDREWAYVPGLNGHNFKGKIVGMCTCRVAQKTAKDAAKGHNSVALEMLHEGRWIQVGHCSMNGKGEVPPVGSYLEIIYLYAVRKTSTVSLIQARLKERRTDVTDESCSTSQLRFRQRLGKE